MYIAELRVENFRCFGEGEHAFVLRLRPGLTALVGENDSGKTAVIDALRFALGARDQEFFRVDDADFHRPPGATAPTKEIRIQCKFEKLDIVESGTFSEYLTYEDQDGTMVPVLYVNWKAVSGERLPSHRRFTFVDVKSGKAGDGPPFDPGSKNYFCATYLRPLRDAERAMSSGRGSRLAQILQYTQEIREYGSSYEPTTDPRELSVLGIGDLTNALLSDHEGVKAARESLNKKYLEPLSFSTDKLGARISVSGTQRDPSLRLRELLEKFDLSLCDQSAPSTSANRGLGSNNVLFMACELLLLSSEDDGFPLLLIEEPEAHLHPQRQLRLMQFLQEKAKCRSAQKPGIQMVITTHSPNLASAIELDNLVLLHGRAAFPLECGHTLLAKSDYRFLSRFLDVTKANLFFCRGLLIVEGDAENILIPVLARLLGRDLTEHGVSIVNVGGTGLRRFARIFQRSRPKEDGIIDVPIACVADFDVMPDCAAEIVKGVQPCDEWPKKKDRRWSAKRDFTTDQLTTRREEIKAKASGQNVQTFVADEWTLEYDLAFAGLIEEVWIAAHLAEKDGQIADGLCLNTAVIREACKSYADLAHNGHSQEELASHAYALYARKSKVSKATAAQYLASLLECRSRKGELTAEALRHKLPKYLVAAIEYVTAKCGTDQVMPAPHAGSDG